jgi:hypothetical protein
MAYRVKDLMIKIVGAGGQGPACGMSTGQACPTATAACQGGTWTTSPAETFCPTATLFCEGGSWTAHMFACPTLTTLWPTLLCPGISATTTTGLVACHASGVCPKVSVTANTWTKCHTGPKCHADAAAAAEQLAMLKAHLKEALEEIERQEEMANEQAQPQTRAEIEELEAKMKEALAELSKRKSELKKE